MTISQSREKVNSTPTLSRKTITWIGTMLGGLTLLGMALGDFGVGDTIPGYVHRIGAGSRVDVRSDATHDGFGWTVTFKRSLLTGDPAHDVDFAPGGTYSFQVATFDNTGGSSHDTTESSTSFDMTIPAAPGPLVFSGTPAQLIAIAGDYLSSEEIQITASWNDITKNDQRKEWVFDGSNWAQSSENEDRVAFIWDMQGDQFASAGTCSSMCHFPYMYTAPGTFVDTWHWKGTRTNPAGHADDKYWDDFSGGGADGGRHSDPGQSVYANNADGGGLPAFMGEEGNGANASFLFSFVEDMREAVAFDAFGGWNAGDSLGGYVHRWGSGSRVDTRATSTHDGSGWTVTFRRKLDTGDASGDILFVPGGTYYYQLATFDNTGGSGHDTTDSSTSFTMTIPATPGPISFTGLPTQLTSITGELLSSDEITITASWSDASRDDNRKQWSYDGASWSQSSENEDRVAFIWDMQGDNFASAGTCATMCHFPYMYTAPATFVDTWHWKGTRTGPAGFADDKYWDDNSGGGADGGRHADRGTSVFKNNLDTGLPLSMSAVGAGASSDYLFEHTPIDGWSRAVPYEEGPPVLTLTAVDSKTISDSDVNWNDNRVRAFWNPQTGSLDGLIKFDLSSIPDTSTITSLTLRTYHEALLGNPLGDPEVKLYRVAEDSWSRATTDPHPGLNEVLTGLRTGFPSGNLASYDWSINVFAATWQTDLIDDTLSIAMRNEKIGGAASFVYWYGSDTNPAPPELIVEFDSCPGSGVLLSYGVGCPGTGGATPSLSAAGCATPGGTVTIGIANGLGGSTAYLFLSASQADLSMGGGCSLLLSPPLELVLVTPLSGSGAGVGEFSLPVTIPGAFPTPTTAYFQVFTDDSGGAKDFSVTNGLQVTVD